MVIRVLLDLLLIFIGLFLITVYRALFPRHLPNTFTPRDLGLDYQEITFPAADGKELSGWMISSSSAKATIICCHGYPANKSDILSTVSFLYPDFNLLLFDFRGHGDSQGRFVSFGLREDRDIRGAINYIKGKEEIKNLPIGIWGYSFGGAVAIKVSTQIEEVKALVTDSTYASFPEMVIQYYGDWGPLKYIFGTGGKLLANIVFRRRLSQLSPENFIGSIKTPILIIHASEDPFVPVEHARRLYRGAKEPKELLILSDTTHSPSMTEEYRERIKNFFERHL